jgi:hypothetical protein
MFIMPLVDVITGAPEAPTEPEVPVKLIVPLVAVTVKAPASVIELAAFKDTLPPDSAPPTAIEPEPLTVNVLVVAAFGTDDAFNVKSPVLLTNALVPAPVTSTDI